MAKKSKKNDVKVKDSKAVKGRGTAAKSKRNVGSKEIKTTTAKKPRRSASAKDTKPQQGKDPRKSSKKNDIKAKDGTKKTKVAATGSKHKEKSEAITQPTPKRSKSSSNKSSSKAKKSSAVTPSPVQVQVPPAPSRWIAYDDLLKGDVRNAPLFLSVDEDWYHIGQSEDAQEKKFHSAVEELIKDSLFSQPFGAKGKEGRTDKSDDSTMDHRFFLKKWRSYAITLVIYPKERLRAVQKEFTKDRKLHSNLLNNLTEEIKERKQGGKRFYLRALNCMFFDAFDRCSIPRPPLPQWSLTINPNNMTRKEIYHQQLIAWNAYKSRVFAMLNVVLENPMEREEEDECGDLPPITPLQHRGDMVPMKEGCLNEEQMIGYKINWDKAKKIVKPTLANNDEAEKKENWERRDQAKKIDKPTMANTANVDAEKKEEWESPVCKCNDCLLKFLAAKLPRIEWEDKYRVDDDDDDDL